MPRLDDLIQPSRETPASRLRIAFELMEAGIDLYRQKLRRQPGMTNEEAERELLRWLEEPRR